MVEQNTAEPVLHNQTGAIVALRSLREVRRPVSAPHPAMQAIMERRSKASSKTVKSRTPSKKPTSSRSPVISNANHARAWGNLPSRKSLPPRPSKSTSNRKRSPPNGSKNSSNTANASSKTATKARASPSYSQSHPSHGGTNGKFRESKKFPLIFPSWLKQNSIINVHQLR